MYNSGRHGRWGDAEAALQPADLKVFPSLWWAGWHRLVKARFGRTAWFGEVHRRFTPQYVCYTHGATMMRAFNRPSAVALDPG